jgi:hypothetical protein
MRWALLLSLSVGVLGSCSRPGACARSPSPAPTPSGGPALRPSSSKKADEEPDRRLLERINEKRGHGARYRAPSAAELGPYAEWIGRVLDQARLGAQPSAPAPPGFVLENAGSSQVLLGEDPRERRGSGLVVLRTGTTPALIIEAPHTYFDKGTLEIAVRCYEVLGARALLLNTVRRSQSEDEELEGEERARLARSGAALSDLAHAEQSFFTAAHTRLALDLSGAALQLHGFRDERLPGVQVVLSAAGSRAPLERLAESLRALLGQTRVATYPDQVKRLGGTRNVQAKASAAAQLSFYHLELARSLRDELITNSAARTAFAEAIRRALVR